MDLNFTPQEEQLRKCIGDFVRTNLPKRIAEKVRNNRQLAREDIAEWHTILNKQGWLAYHWPEQYGGTGWGAVERFIFENECALADAPRIVPFGVNMLGPVLIKYGSEAQRKHWLPRILSGVDWWCQGYSEPGAGSDLASLKTSAVAGIDAQGNHYIVNGQKTWITLGHYANMIFCLVRTATGARKQEGISFLLIDMKSPGVEVRPIVTLDGEHEINEVFFTNVRVPAENLVGEENKGWACAKYLLTYERTNIAGVGLSVAALQRLRQVAAKITCNGHPLSEDSFFAARLARVEIDLENMKTTNLRMVMAVADGGAPDAESSMLKIRGTEIRQEISSLLRRAMGPHAQLLSAEGLSEDGVEAADATAFYLNNRKLSIYGGSNEIQKNIVAKMILGL